MKKKIKTKKTVKKLRAKRIWHLPFTILGAIALIASAALYIAFSMAAPPEPWPASWPNAGDWHLLTKNGIVIADYEERAGCKDLTTGGAAPSQANDIGSQAICSKPIFNPGFGTGQPGATAANTYSSAILFKDINGDSDACSNLNDDYMFFRIRLADAAVDDGKLEHNIWSATLDIDDNGTADFYVRLIGGSGSDPNNDKLEIIQEKTGNFQVNGPGPGQDYLVKSYSDPIGNGWVTSAQTPDNGTVGDTTEYFLDLQVPLTKFKNSGGTQTLCEGDSVSVFEYNTFTNPTNPSKKDQLSDGPSDPIIVGPPPPALNADLSITKTDEITAAVPGTSVTYTITAKNNGPSNVTGATVTDSLSPILYGASWTCSASAGSTCSPSGTGSINDSSVNLLNGGTATYTITANIEAGATGSLINTASVTPPLSVTDSNTGNNDSTDTDSLTPVTDLAITKRGPTDPVLAGNNLTYTINVTNNGPSDATGIIVTDTLPEGVTFVSASPTSGSCSHNAGIVTCNIPSLLSGNYENIMLIVGVPADMADTTLLINTSSVSGNETDPDQSNNGGESSTVVTLIGVGADLSVIKSGIPNPVVAGNPLTYTITVTNDGPSNAQNVIVTDMLPSNTAFVSAVPVQGDCSENTGIITCNLGDMATGQSINITVVGTPLTDGQTTGYVGINNTVSVTSSTLDPDSTDNTASAETSVSPNADLSITKTASPDPVYAGYQLTYSLTVTNNGPTAAANVTVTDTLPSGVNFVSATPDQGICQESQETIGVTTCNLGVLNNGSSVNIEIIIIVPSETTSDTILTNTATVRINDDCVPDGGSTCNPIDPNPENNTAVTETGVAVTGGRRPPSNPPPSGGGETPPPAIHEAAPVEAVQPAEERKYCLGYDPNRYLTFLDMDQASLLTPFPVPAAKLTDLQKALVIIKNTYIANLMLETEATQVSDIFAFGGKQWVVSGYPTRDAVGVPVTKGTTSFIGPFANTTRLELAKVLLISHCYPILNSLELTTRYNSDEALHVWDDLPNVDLGDPISNYARDVAYSAQYWWVWDGFWNTSKQKFDRVGINDLITVAQVVKMNDRLGQLVKGATNFTQDATEGLWWKPYYAHANLELASIVTPEFLYTARADEVFKRGEGIYNVLKVMIARDLYSPTDLALIKKFLSSKDTTELTGKKP